MGRSNAILGLLTQTSLHAGTGQNTGVIDLSIQREGHNGWPCVFGSAVKGAIRTHAEDRESENIHLVFGSEANSNEAHAGAVAFSDARLLLFPVRSLTSQFKWVTCPAALKRYKNDAARMGKEVSLNLPETSLTENIALISKGQEEIPLFLEEYRFEAKQSDLKEIIKVLSELMLEDEAEKLLCEQLVIISDDMFSYIVQHTTPVNAHIAIDSETKTVRSSALWYEETLPPESLLYVSLSAAKGRNKGQTSSGEMRDSVTNLFPEHSKSWVQLGGNETVGMGWCAVKVNKMEA